MPFLLPILGCEYLNRLSARQAHRPDGRGIGQAVCPGKNQPIIALHHARKACIAVRCDRGNQMNLAHFARRLNSSIDKALLRRRQPTDDGMKMLSDLPFATKKTIDVRGKKMSYIDEGGPMPITLTLPSHCRRATTSATPRMPTSRLRLPSSTSSVPWV